MTVIEIGIPTVRSKGSAEVAKSSDGFATLRSLRPLMTAEANHFHAFSGAWKCLELQRTWNPVDLSYTKGYQGIQIATF